MRKGILEYCILLILSRGDSYAPKIIAELKNARMIVVEGTLYPILTRQKNQGLCRTAGKRSPQGPPRKYYSITDKGREALSQLDVSWDELIAQIAQNPRPLTAGRPNFRTDERGCESESISGIAFSFDAEAYQ